MFIRFILFLMLIAPAYSQKDTISSSESYRVIIKNYEEEVYDDGITRKKYFPFKIFEGNKVIAKVGETWDYPAEILLPKGKYLIVSQHPKEFGERDTFFIEVKENSVFNLAENSAKKK